LRGKGEDVMASYKTWARWVEGHRGSIRLSNGPELDFSAPPSLHGHEGVLTPEDAFVAALNTCYTMMFLWACERGRIELVSYACETECYVKDYLDRTSVFDRAVLRPRICARGGTVQSVERALKSALKYSLVAQSIKAEVVLEPEIEILESIVTTSREEC
jgi:organic hydroperoxide reductase OsmC/OhrA